MDKLSFYLKSLLFSFFLFSSNLIYSNIGPEPTDTHGCVNVDSISLSSSEKFVVGCVSRIQAAINRDIIEEAIKVARIENRCIEFPQGDVYIDLDFSTTTFNQLQADTVYFRSETSGRIVYELVYPLINFSDFYNEIIFNNTEIIVNTYSIFQSTRRSLLFEMLNHKEMINGELKNVFCNNGDNTFIDPCQTGSSEICDENGPLEISCEPCPMCVQVCPEFENLYGPGNCNSLYSLIDSLVHIKTAVMLVNNDCDNNEGSFPGLNDFSITGVNISIEEYNNYYYEYNSEDSINPIEEIPSNIFDNPFVYLNDCNDYNDSVCEASQQLLNGNTVQDTTILNLFNPCQVSNRPWYNNLIGLYLNLGTDETICNFDNHNGGCGISKNQSLKLAQVKNIEISNLSEGLFISNAHNLVISNVDLNNFTDAAFTCTHSTGVYLYYSRIGGGRDGNCGLLFSVNNCHVINCKITGLNRSSQVAVLEQATNCSFECNYIFNSTNSNVIVNWSDGSLIESNKIYDGTRGILVRTTDNPNSNFGPSTNTLIHSNSIYNTVGNMQNAQGGIVLWNSEDTEIIDNFINSNNPILIGNDRDGVTFHPGTIIEENELYPTLGGASISTSFNKDLLSNGCIELSNLTIQNNEFYGNIDLNENCYPISFPRDGAEIILDPFCYGCFIGQNYTVSNLQRARINKGHHFNPIGGCDQNLSCNTCLSACLETSLVGQENNHGFHASLISERNLQNISVFINPNISSGIYEVYFSDEPNEKIEISIVSTDMKLIKKFKDISSKSRSIDLSAIPNGMYFCLIRYGKEKVIKKIIKI